MVNFIRTVDKDGFTTESRRRSRLAEHVPISIRGVEENSKIRSDSRLNQGKSIKVERKVIGGSMGKKG
ncbi:hypothetical protein MKW98_028909, partial [Papaver atlanticum]